MIDKYKKLITLIKWLEQGRILEIDDVEYGISEEGNIIRMYSDEKGVELPTLNHIWSLLNKISDDKFFIMNGEIVLTDINNRRTNER